MEDHSFCGTELLTKSRVYKFTV